MYDGSAGKCSGVTRSNNCRETGLLLCAASGFDPHRSLAAPTTTDVTETFRDSATACMIAVSASAEVKGMLVDIVDITHTEP